MYEALLAQLDRLCSGRNYPPLFFPQGELLPVEKLDGPRARRLQAFEAAGREYAETGTLSEQTLAGVQRPMVDPRVYEILARAQWRGGAERNKQP